MVGESGVSRGKDIYRYYKCVNARKHTCDKKTVRKEWKHLLKFEPGGFGNQ